MTRFDAAALDEIRRRIGLPDLAARLGIELKRKGREYLGLCPFHNERTPSFTIVPGKFYHCFGCGAHGDVIGLVMRLKAVDFHEAVRMLAEESGVALSRLGAEATARAGTRAKAAAEAAERDRAGATARALEIWQSCHPAAGTPVETYLGQARKIPLALIGGVPASLRYHPALHHSDTGLYLPAMVGGVQGADGRVVAVHRTYLKHDGSGKAACSSPKKMLGPVWGGAVRLGPATATLNLAEGIETSLTAAAIVKGAALKGLRDGASAAAAEAGAGLIASVWAALSLGNLAGGGRATRARPHPERRGVSLPSVEPDMTRPGIILPPIVRRVIIWLDRDNKDPASAAVLADRARRRYELEEREVEFRRLPPGEDFNSWLTKPFVEPGR